MTPSETATQASGVARLYRPQFPVCGSPAATLLVWSVASLAPPFTKGEISTLQGTSCARTSLNLRRQQRMPQLSQFLHKQSFQISLYNNFGNYEIEMTRNLEHVILTAKAKDTKRGIRQEAH